MSSQSRDNVTKLIHMKKGQIAQTKKELKI